MFYLLWNMEGEAGAMGVPYVIVYVLIHRRGNEKCKPLSIKQATYPHSYTHLPCFTGVIHILAYIYHVSLALSRSHDSTFGADTLHATYLAATLTYSIATSLK
jgi:hypothetical protein